MNDPARIASTRFHRVDSATFGAGGQAVNSFLRSHAGEDYAVVEIDRKDTGRYSLILDPEWVELAQQTQATNPELVDDMELPRRALRAVVAGWASDWCRATADLSVEHSPDRIPHLRLTGLRPSTTGADRNVRPF